MSNVGNAKDKVVSRRKDARGFRKLIASLSCMVVVVIAMALMVPAISMTHGELVCGMEEHVHSKGCYEQVLVCGRDEGDGVDPETGESGHVHSKSCYEKQLVCDIPEHKHSDACYAPEQSDDEDHGSAGAEDAAGAGASSDGDSDAGDSEGESAGQSPESVDQPENGEADNQNLDCDAAEDGEAADTQTGDGQDLEQETADGKLATHALTASGDAYEITVTYGSAAQIPEGAELRVREITESDAGYARQLKEADAALKADGKGALNNPALFDIGIFADDQEVEPADGSEVQVKIWLANQSETMGEAGAENPEGIADAADIARSIPSNEDQPRIWINGQPANWDSDDSGTAISVVHHAEDGQAVVVQDVETTSDMTGETVEFATDSFSKYTLGGNIGQVANTPATVYVGDEIYYHGPIKSSNSNIAEVQKRGSADGKTYHVVKIKQEGEVTISYGWNDNRRTYAESNTVKVKPYPQQNWKPATIDTVPNSSSGITLNLFDYDLNGQLNEAWNSGGENGGGSTAWYLNKGINAGKNLKFWTMCPGYKTSSNNWNNNWSVGQYRQSDNIVASNLADGYPTVGGQSLDYLFNPASKFDGDRTTYKDADGLFKYSNGYLVYDSSENYAYYNKANNKFEVYDATFQYGQNGSKHPIGFFPFHPYNKEYEQNLSTVSGHQQLNHHFGMSMSAKFAIPADGKDVLGQPISYEFSGDDDMWVFIDDDLALDIGGIHQPVTGRIEFNPDGNGGINAEVKVYDNQHKTWSTKKTINLKANKEYTLRSFYLERGGGDSNCKIMFNIPTYKSLDLSKRLYGLTATELEKYKDEEFTYELEINGQPYETPADAAQHDELKALVMNEKGEIVDRIIIKNGQVKLKPGQTVRINHLARTDQFYVAEEKSLNMDQFEAPHAEREYVDGSDGAEHEEEITLTPSHTDTQATDVDLEDWKTDTYKVNETDKVTFTNTMKEKDLEVEKVWKGENDHPNEVTFTVGAAVEGEDGAPEPYEVEALKNANGTPKVFTLDEGHGWRVKLDHLPVQDPNGNFIVYGIKESAVSGYVSSTEDLTAETYSYCNVDAVKLWPDDAARSEVITVKLKNAAGNYYAGVDAAGEALFDGVGTTYTLEPGNGYSHRFERLPYDDTYTVEQVGDQDARTTGLVTYKRNIIQYQLVNTPSGEQVDPEGPKENPEIHKRIDALRDGVENPDSEHKGEDLTDLYRLYLDYKINSLQEANGVDLLFVIDHSGSMNSNHYGGNQFRARSVERALNGTDGFIHDFIEMGKLGNGESVNRWAAVGFKGPSGRDYRTKWGFENDFRSKHAGINDSEILSGDDCSWRTNDGDISLPLELQDRGAFWDPSELAWVAHGEAVLTDYTAGFWRAEQFLKKGVDQTDGRKKVIVFISDGIPTLHITGLDQAESLEGAGDAIGSKYYPDSSGGCPIEAKREFGYFVKDMTEKYGYTFGEDAEFYTIGFGSAMGLDTSKQLLKDMLDIAYGGESTEGHFMTINDVDPYYGGSDFSATTALKSDLQTIMGMNESFSNIAIQDTLSRYVDLHGGSLESSKAKLTMTDPNDATKTVTLFENGNVTEAGKGILQSVSYDSSAKKVTATFDPAYEALPGITYTLSFDVHANETAYTTYAKQGYDAYAEGDKKGQAIVGDKDTDFLGTDPANATSVDKPGFRSNGEAEATYKHNGEPESKTYRHPVIQVSPKIVIVKQDDAGKALEGAQFSLYREGYDAAKDASANAEFKVGDYVSTKASSGAQAIVFDGKLEAGVYWLVETKSPAGYNALPAPVKIEVSESQDTKQPSVSASIAGTSVGDKLTKDEKMGVWTLKVLNTAGKPLPNTGGPGTTGLHLLGALLVVLAAAILLRKRQPQS